MNKKRVYNLFIRQANYKVVLLFCSSDYTMYCLDCVAQKHVLNSAGDKDEEVNMKKRSRKHKRNKGKKQKKIQKKPKIKTDCDADSGEDTEIYVSDEECPSLKRQNCMYEEELLALMSKKPA